MLVVLRVKEIPSRSREGIIFLEDADFNIRENTQRQKGFFLFINTILGEINFS